MECIKCGHALEDGVLFCPYCGAKVEQTGQGEDTPLYVAEVKGLLKSGTLTVYRDRVEFSTSSAQKTIFNYSALVSVKKGIDRIHFVTEDGRTEACAVSMKYIHEAFLYIEKAVQPYLEERKNALLAQGVRYSFVSSVGLTSGILNISEDQVEFKAKSGQSEVVSFRDVKSASLSARALELLMVDGRTKAFGIDKEQREEILAFVEESLQPFRVRRQEELLERGIYFSSLSSGSAGSGTLDLYSDRAEFTSQSGRAEIVPFCDLRKVSLSMSILELALVNGTAKTYPVEKDLGEDMLAFVEKAIEPYVLERTVGFDTAFGIDEKIEINEERGVFHILRQAGSEITPEAPMAAIVKCERVESSTPASVIGGVLTGGMAILNSATKGQPNNEEKISYVSVVLTLRTDEGEETKEIRFGNFLLGMSRSNPKYERYVGEAIGFMDYLTQHYPDCELVIPILPEIAPQTEEPQELSAVEEPEELPAPPEPTPQPTAADRDQFGIIRYIEGVSGFISECATPMTIAIQGNWGSGKNGIMNLLFDQLQGQYEGSLFWLHTREFAQTDVDKSLPVQVGRFLMNQLSGVDNSGGKDRAVQAAKGFLSITTSILTQGGTDGQNLMDALFKDNGLDSVEKCVRAFSELVRKKGGEQGKAIIFVDELDRFAPSAQVGLLEALRNYFDCEGCVFVVNVDYNSVLRGGTERFGREFDEAKGKSFFDKLFQVSFRVPTSGFNIENYVKDKLTHIETYTGDEEELALYIELIKNSVGYEPKGMDRLFNSFLLLKRLASEETYASKDRRLTLFALLCMQAKFPLAYTFIAQAGNRVDPDFLLDLCGRRPELWDEMGLSQEGKADFQTFARVFHDVINLDKAEGISQAECQAFRDMLEVSGITFK